MRVFGIRRYKMERRGGKLLAIDCEARAARIWTYWFFNHGALGSRRLVRTVERNSQSNRMRSMQSTNE
jgi:hypothetical protein